MTVTIKRYHNIKSEEWEPYKIYAVKAIYPHPRIEGASELLLNNGKTDVVRTDLIIMVKEGRK